jgi:hypothetical protein
MITRHVLKWHIAPLRGEHVGLGLVRLLVGTLAIVAKVFLDVT